MIEELILLIKNKLPNVTPTLPVLHADADVYELKSHFQWGEPALTIFDVRNLAAFRACRIMKATSRRYTQHLVMATEYRLSYLN